MDAKDWLKKFCESDMNKSPMDFLTDLTDIRGFEVSGMGGRGDHPFDKDCFWESMYRTDDGGDEYPIVLVDVDLTEDYDESGKFDVTISAVYNDMEQEPSFFKIDSKVFKNVDKVDIRELHKEIVSMYGVAKQYFVKMQNRK